MKKKALKIILLTLTVIVVSSIGGFLIFTSFYYHADEIAVDLVENDLLIEEDGGLVIFYPEAADDMNQGLIFYPGGNVEYIAYAPLLKQLAEEGITCFLVKMPFNMALFGINKANAIVDAYDFDTWYIAGHSLGGAMMSQHLKNYADQYAGCIYLDAYPINDAEIDDFVIFSSELKVEEYADKVEADYVIDGGNHAQFGNYGIQKGDNVATISREEQQRLTVEQMIMFMSE